MKGPAELLALKYGVVILLPVRMLEQNDARIASCDYISILKAFYYIRD
jgi:hypothetical protein